jgi:hypothetical protein
LIPGPFEDKLISQQQGSFDDPEKWKYVGNDDILKRFIRYFTDFRFCDLLPEPERGYQVRQVFLQLFLSYRRMLFVTQITACCQDFSVFEVPIVDIICFSTVEDRFHVFL